MSQFPQMNGAGTAGYSPISFYDKPSVLLEQILDGDMSFASVRDTLFNSDKLTPHERDTLGDRLRGMLGVAPGPSLANGLIDAATNPLTWLVLLSSPPGRSALRKGGSLFKGVGVKGLYPLLHAAGFLTGSRAADSIGAAELLTELGRRFRDVKEESGVWLQGMYQQVKKGLGTTHIDEMTPERRKFEAYITAKLDGMLSGSSYRPLRTRVMAMEQMEDGSLRPIGWSATKPEGKDVVAHDGGWVDIDENFLAYSKWQVAMTSWNDDYARLMEDEKRAKTAWAKSDIKNQKDALSQYKPEPPILHTYRAEGEAAEREVRTAWPLTNGEKAKFHAYEASNPWAKKFADDLRAEYDRRHKELFLDKDGKPDPDKIWRHMAGGAEEQLDPATRNRQMKEAFFAGIEGHEALRLMTSDPVLRNALLGKGKEAYLKNLSEVLDSVKVTDYIPYTKKQGVKLTEEEARFHVANPGERERMLRVEEDVAPKGTGSFIGRQSFDHNWHDEDVLNFEAMLGKDSPSMEGLWASHKEARRKALQEKGEMPLFTRRSPLASLESYLHRSDAAKVLDLEDATDFTKTRWRDWVSKNKPTKGKMSRGDDFLNAYNGRKNNPDLSDDVTKELGITGGTSRRDLLKTMLEYSAGNGDDKHIRDQIRTTIKMMAGEESHSLGLHKMAFETSRRYMRTFAESGVGKWLEENAGQAGRDFVSGLKKISEDGFEDAADKLGNNLARYFYVSHLGLNLGSVAMNLTQPLLFVAPHLGSRATLEGLKDTIVAFHGYGMERMRMGVRPNAKERLRLMEKWFPHAKELGIGDNELKQLDERIYGGRAYREGKLSRIEGALMKSFEVSERWNRVLTGNIVKAAYRQNGLKAEGDGFLYDLHRMVSETQYGSSPENTPHIFQKGPLSWAPLRQFAAFPLRTALGALDVFPNLTNPDNYWKGALTTTMRAVGASALAYELLKGSLGADVSKGLYASSVTDLVGGERFGEEGNDWIQVPPIIAVPKDMIAALSQDDHDAYAQALGRLLPAGVPISRAIGIAPDMGSVGGLPDPGDLQKTYVDWGNPDPSTGMLPVYSSDHRLIEFKSKLELYQRAIGLDAGKWTDVGKFDNYMVTQRAQILDYKSRYLTAISNSNFNLANSISNEFYKRYKVKLSVGRDQLNSFQESRARVRSERILDRVSPDVRGQFMDMMANTPGVGSGLTREQLFSAPTARGRDRDFQGITPEQMAELKRRIDAVGGAGARDGSPFDRF